VNEIIRETPDEFSSGSSKESGWSAENRQKVLFLSL